MTIVQTAPSVSPPVGEVSTQLTEGLTERTHGRAALKGGRGKPLPYGTRGERYTRKNSEFENQTSTSAS